MFNNNKILVVIPADGGSKEIPRKNIRLLYNKPLIYYAITIAKSSQYVDDVVVATDDNDISMISEKYGANVIRCSADLSGGNTPLDSIVYNTMIQKEKITFDEYDIVITLDPSSPLIKTQTLNRVIEKFNDFSIDNVITVVDDRHLSWGFDENNQRFFPNYIERVSNDKLPKSFRETGGILASRRHCVHENTRLGTNIDLIEVSKAESVYICNFDDWWIADNYLQRKKIAFVVNAYEEIGTGHIDRCLSIASRLILHDVLFLLDKHYQLGIDIISEFNFPFEIYNNEKELHNILNQYSPQLVINDILDTSEDYVSSLKDEGYFVVNFDDLGLGTNHADVVFDSFYEHDFGEENVFSGYKYFVLKDEFYFRSSKFINEGVSNVLVAFGTSDPDNLTEKVVDSILSTNYEGRVNVILGLANNNLERLISKYERNPLIQIYRNVSNISEFMYNADIIFTSAGRVMYEVCSMGVPTICLCQNERELTHKFVNENNGFINLGLGNDVENQQIIDEFIRLFNNFDLRVEMNSKMLSIDLKNGFENIWSVITDQYRKFELNNQNK